VPFLLPATPCLLVASAQATRASEDPVLVAAKLETLRRILPDAPEAAEGVAGLQRTLELLALRASFDLVGLSTVAHQEVVANGVGYVPADVTLVLKTSADPDAVSHGLAAFLDSLERLSRLPIFDRLSFQAQADGSLRLACLVRLYFQPPVVPALEGSELVKAKVATIEKLKAEAGWPRWRLGALTRKGSPRTYLTSLVLEPQKITATGVAPWPATARDWARSFPLDVTSLEWAQEDACQRFTAHARFRHATDEAPRPAEGPALGAALLVGRAADDVSCGAPAPSGPRLPPIRRSGQGPLTLRGRALDLVEVVLLLARAAGQALVVDDDVAGRVDVELENVTLDQALAALEPYGVFASPPATIRRVSRGARPVALVLPTGQEAPASFWFWRARFEDVFSLLADASGDGVLVPRPPLPAVSVYASDLPGDVVYTAVAAAAGLALRHEAGLFRAERPGTAAQELVAAVSKGGGAPPPLATVSAEQLALSALTANGKTWTAWMLTPRGSLLGYAAGDRFLGGQVFSVDARGVELRTEITDPRSPLRIRTRWLELAR
jgi:hypothetical protein